MPWVGMVAPPQRPQNTAQGLALPSLTPSSLQCGLGTAAGFAQEKAKAEGAGVTSAQPQPGEPRLKQEKLRQPSST